MTLIKCKQNSAEWLQERVGCVTASRVKDVMDFLKQTKAEAEAGTKRPSAKRKDYMAEIIAETLTGIAAEHYVSPYMQWGSEYEREARAAYEIESGNIVDETGIFAHDKIARFKASPDGLIGKEGLWEGKCPQTTTHLGWAWFPRSILPSATHRWLALAGYGFSSPPSIRACPNHCNSSALLSLSGTAPRLQRLNPRCWSSSKRWLRRSRS